MRQDVVDRVKAITREKIAPRAPLYDREGKNPVESWADLHREGYLACAVPAAYGGMGLDMATYAAVIRTIARGCASTAMTVHMHSTVMRFIDALGTDQQKRRYYAEVVDRGRMFGSWGSEPAVSLSRTFLTETTVRAVDGGYQVDGVKYFCTMALGASYYMVWCALDGSTDMATSLVLAVIPAESPGISTDGKWDTLGMRATYSPSVTLSKVRIPPDATLGAPGQATGVGVIESFALGYAAVYVGIAEAAFEFTAHYVKQRVVKPENVPVANDPAVQRQIGDLEARLDAARLVLHDSATRWEAADPVARGHLANRAKYLGTEIGLHVTSHALQITGGRGAYRDYPVERAYRDLRTASLMPPTMDRMIEGMGKIALGLGGGMFQFGAGHTAASGPEAR
ncbi:MAG TPA: acyl-CoA dehydrogenase family protein [Candidatus Bathyarchaeia archaeon]|nr:acyl-CoA dehydrogenase family protein [Candidatus Bathyarchaeia archaeon]